MTTRKMGYQVGICGDKEVAGHGLSGVRVLLLGIGRL